MATVREQLDLPAALILLIMPLRDALLLITLAKNRVSSMEILK